MQDFDGRTALHQAIRYNRPSEAKWLIGHGAHLDVPDFEGLLPLHQVRVYACVCVSGLSAGVYSRMRMCDMIGSLSANTGK